MRPETERRDRLHRLIDFARIYRGWGRAELARTLGRDSTKLYPETGNPKLDFLVALADVLEWPVSDVVEYLWSGDAAAARGPQEGDFEAQDKEARAAHERGAFEEMVEIARRMYLSARTAEQRARACNREHGAWDGLGRYTKALEAVCRGLQESPIPSARHYQLQTNLANTHYALWELTAALAHAHVVVEWYEKHAPATAIDRKNQAFAHYVRGQTNRRLMIRYPDTRAEYARNAECDLQRCCELYGELSRELGDARLPGIAHTCEGALIEVAVELGKKKPAAAVNELMSGLDAVVDLEAPVVGDWLESYGWWAIFGCNLSVRHLNGRALQQSMAVFTNKALEIADRLGNWALRERVFTMQFKMHETLVNETGLDLPFTIDDEDKRLITGTMGRFPTFRDTGWKIFRTGKLVRDAEGN